MAKSKGSTPVMKQFWEAKKLHPNAIMLFRMGDFYETFDDDAVLASEILSITLTKRSNGAASTIPLAGFPYHSLEQHLHKLLKAGHRVAICEQVEDPKKAPSWWQKMESDSSDDALRIWTDDFVAGVLSAVVVICVLSIYLWVL